MDDSVLYFSTNIVEIKEKLYLSCTNRPFDKMERELLQPIHVLKKLSKQKCVTLLRNVERQDSFQVFLEDGRFTITFTETAEFIIVDYVPNKLQQQNWALKNGVTFSFSNIIIKCSGDRQGGFFDIKDGYESPSSKPLLLNNRKILNQIISNLSKEDIQEETSVAVNKKLERYLDIADGYAQLTSDLEQAAINQIGRIPYSKFEPIQYEQLDREIYRFTFEYEDEQDVLVEGTMLTVPTKTSEELQAEIVKSQKGEDCMVCDLLFTRQIDVSQLAKQESVTLSFSTVNKDVQQAAIERIRKKEAQATYFENVLGNYTTKGFDQIDLRGLEQRLNQKKYPPNPSQMEAIKKGIQTKDVFLVMGPPGTGKTTVILEWVKYFIKEQGLRVLISSQNNKAVDNVLARIQEEKDIDVLRVGSQSKVQSEVVPYLYENKVRNLRDNITTKSSKHLSELSLAYQHARAEKLCLEQYLEYFRKSYPKLQVFNQGLEEYVVNRYQQLKELWKENIYLKMNLIELKNEYKEKSELLTQLQQETFFKRVLHIFKYLITKRRVKKIPDVFANTKQSLERVIQSYSDTYQKYEDSYKKYEKVYMSTILEIDDQLKTMWQAVKEKNSKINRTYFKMEQTLEDSIRMDEQKMLSYVQELRQHLNVNGTLQVILKEWNATVADNQNYGLQEIVLGSVDLVGATCIGINSQKRFSELEFDVTIIDEAGQIQIHNALVPMHLSNKLIMLGDHKQIPPNADQELVDLCEDNGVDSSLLGKSLFEDMYNHLPNTNKIMLDTQFRMPNQIADILSENFYNNKYMSHDSKKNQQSIYPFISKQPMILIDTSKVKNRFETKEEGHGCYNELESNIVKDIMKVITSKLQESGEPVEEHLREIGIISAYKLQVQVMKQALKGVTSNEIIQEMVASLDSYQGQERDLIIYSFTKSSKISASRSRIGFLKELRRLNVAMSRCKKMLIMIGDFDFLSSCENEDDQEMSEKDFSIFIQNMLRRVKDDHYGEYISYDDFANKLKEIK